MCSCSSEHLSTNSDPSVRAGGLLGPQSRLQTACPVDGGGELGLLWGCRQEPVSLHGLLSPGLDACAMDNQQLWRALRALLQIPRASPYPVALFSLFHYLKLILVAPPIFTL